MKLKLKKKKKNAKSFLWFQVLHMVAVHIINIMCNS